VKIEIDIAALGRSKWYEYVLRFAFGGLVTAIAGVIAKHYGPGIGGLFLAFPAIFPATATLLESHEKQKKEHAGRSGTVRARELAGADAAGAAMGSLGLMVFAVIVWRELSRYPEVPVLIVATVAWLLVSVSTWFARKTIWRDLRTKFFGRSAGAVGARGELSKNRRSHE
jgi:Protein of unknown function (DUF3147)